MAYFPVLDFEKEIQVGDQTRFDATKSFSSKDSGAITEVSLEMGTGGTVVTLSPLGSPTPATTAKKEWYTDWVWSSWSFDVDSTANKIDFEEAGVDYAATVATSVYSSLSSLASAIQTALNAAGATGTFTVTLNPDSSFSIDSTVPFRILNYTGDNRFTGLLQHLGFSYKDSNTLTSHNALPVEYGRKKITLTVNDGTNPDVSTSFYQNVYTEYGDRLFCTDDDLAQYEQDLKKWIIIGRSSHKNTIRKANQLIVEYFNANGFVNSLREPYTKWDIKALRETRDWCAYLTLQLLMEGNSNAVDDLYAKKSLKYASLAGSARNRYLSIDIDGDGKADFDEYLTLPTIGLFRR